jgi:hypothetical protein
VQPRTPSGADEAVLTSSDNGKRKRQLVDSRVCDFFVKAGTIGIDLVIQVVDSLNPSRPIRVDSKVGKKLRVHAESIRVGALGSGFN